MPTWLASTRGKNTATLNGDEEIRVVDDPAGTPVSAKTTVDALKNYISTNINATYLTEAEASAQYLTQAAAAAAYQPVDDELTALATVGTRASVASVTVPASVSVIRTTGYATAGDGGGWTYVRVGSEPSHAGKVQDAAGAWFEIIGNRVPVEVFGAVAYTQAELVALNGAASVDTQATANVTAFSDANTYIKAVGGGTILAPGPIYVLNGAVRRGQGVYIEGSGVGEWEPIYPQRSKTWEGTTLLFKGTGTADVTFTGITSMMHGGGWREDPSNPGTYFKLWSAYDDDATGTTAATALSFSVAVMPETDANYGGLRHLRICNWIGTDGITDWSNTGSSSLGDDWDFGYVLKNNEYADDFNIQVVGGWREAAHGQFATAITNSVSERNSIRRAKFQGRRGMMIRAQDRWHVTATTANSVTIYFSTESYWATSGTFRGSDNVTYTYTGITHSGVDTAFTFTGVTPDPSAIFQVRHPGSGFGNSEYVDVYAYGLDHQGGSRASALGYVDSKPLEISGFPLRGIKFTNCKFHTSEPVIFQIHDAQDITFISYQVEGVAHVIASPVRTEASYANAAVGETRNITMIAGVGMTDQTRTLFTPRSGYVEELQTNPSDDLTADLTLRPLRDTADIVLEASDGTNKLAWDSTTDLWTASAPAYINVSSSSDALLIQQTGAGNALRVNDTSGDTSPVVIDASGRLIVGHTETVGTYPLEVHGTDFASYRWNGASATGPSWRINRSRSSTLGTQTVLQSNDVVGNLIFGGSDGTAFIPAAQITVVVDGTPGTNDMPGKISFRTTADGAAAATERLSIDSAGSVGIGGTSYGSGSLVIFIANASVVPSTNPTGGGVLYCEGGALKFRGSGGTVTTIANA